MYIGVNTYGTRSEIESVVAYINGKDFILVRWVDRWNGTTMHIPLTIEEARAIGLCADQMEAY